MCEHEKGFHCYPKYPSFEECVRFHGHACPGLATGYRVATAAMNTLGVERPNDEEIVCVAETDACGVDAIQMVTGCTAGKGNLIIRDYGKHAFSFYARQSGRAVRILISRMDMPDSSEMNAIRKKVFSGNATSAEQARFDSLKKASLERILAAPEESLLTITKLEGKPPREARIFASVSCARCGEPVADAKTRLIEGSRVCIPCAESIAKEKADRTG